MPEALFTTDILSHHFWINKHSRSLKLEQPNGIQPSTGISLTSNIFQFYLILIMQIKYQITNFKHSCIVCAASIDIKLKINSTEPQSWFFLYVCECFFFKKKHVPEVEFHMENICILYLWDIRIICVKQYFRRGTREKGWKQTIQ